MLERLSDDRLVARAAAGDDAAFTALCARYDRLMAAIVADFYAAGLERQDLIQEARIALHTAARTHRPETRVPFSAFAHMVIRRRVMSAVRAALRGKHDVVNGAARLEQPAGPHAVELTVGDLIAGPDHTDPAVQLQLREDLAILLEVITCDLTHTEREAAMRSMHGVPLAEIPGGAKSADNAVQRARRRIERALAA